MLLRPGLTCPTAAIALRGQNLSVAFVGPKPYIIESEGSSSPVGSDVDLIKFLARHFEFDFSLHRAFTFDWRRFKNGTSYGITYRVTLRNVLCNYRRSVKVVFLRLGLA